MKGPASLLLLATLGAMLLRSSSALPIGNLNILESLGEELSKRFLAGGLSTTTEAPKTEIPTNTNFTDDYYGQGDANSTDYDYGDLKDFNDTWDALDNFTSSTVQPSTASTTTKSVVNGLLSGLNANILAMFTTKSSTTTKLTTTSATTTTSAAPETTKSTTAVTATTSSDTVSTGASSSVQATTDAVHQSKTTTAETGTLSDSSVTDKGLLTSAQLRITTSEALTDLVVNKTTVTTAQSTGRDATAATGNGPATSPNQEDVTVARAETSAASENAANATEIGSALTNTLPLIVSEAKTAASNTTIGGSMNVYTTATQSIEFTTAEVVSDEVTTTFSRVNTTAEFTKTTNASRVAKAAASTAGTATTVDSLQSTSLATETTELKGATTDSVLVIVTTQEATTAEGETTTAGIETTVGNTLRPHAAANATTGKMESVAAYETTAGLTKSTILSEKAFTELSTNASEKVTTPSAAEFATTSSSNNNNNVTGIVQSLAPTTEGALSPEDATSTTGETTSVPETTPKHGNATTLRPNPQNAENSTVKAEESTVIKVTLSSSTVTSENTTYPEKTTDTTSEANTAVLFPVFPGFPFNATLPSATEVSSIAPTATQSTEATPAPSQEPTTQTPAHTTSARPASTTQRTTSKAGTTTHNFSWVKTVPPAEDAADAAVATAPTRGSTPSGSTSEPDLEEETTPDDDIGLNFWNYDDYPTESDDNVTAIYVAQESVTLAFFKLNWYWILIGVILIILLFVVPGMLMQIYCHKFYIFYRREKNKKMPDSSVSEEPTDYTDNELEGGAAAPIQPPIVAPAVATSKPTPENQPPDPPEPSAPSADPTPPNQTAPHRVDVYTGPCSIDSMNYPSLGGAQPDVGLPTMQLACAAMQDQAPVPQASSYLYPSIQHEAQNQASFVPHEPVVVYSIPVKDRANTQETGQRKTFGDEAIIDSNRTQPKDRQPSADRPRLRVPKPAEYSAPARPPKPQQYRVDKPVPKSSNYRDYKRPARDSRPWAEHRRRPRPKEMPKPDKIIVDNPRGNDYGRESNPERKKRTVSASTAARELRRKEELLRQLIKGFNEAEMLQKKLDRTRQWTKEQNKRDGARGERHRSRRKDEGEEKKKDSKRDRPPRYEEVMSDASKSRPAAKPKRRSEGRRRAAR